MSDQNFPFICSNIRAAPEYGVYNIYISQLIRYSRLTVSVSQMTTEMFHLSVISSFMTCHRVCNQINTTDATSGAGIANPSGAPEFTPGFEWGSCYSIFSFMCMFCRSLFVLFLLAIVLSVFLRFIDSDYPFGIFRLFLQRHVRVFFT